MFKSYLKKFKKMKLKIWKYFKLYLTNFCVLIKTYYNSIRTNKIKPVSTV